MSCLYVLLSCRPYMSFLYVVLICPAFMLSLYVLHICPPYLSAFFVRLICPPYMSALYVGMARSARIHRLRRPRSRPQASGPHLLLSLQLIFYRCNFLFLFRCIVRFSWPFLPFMAAMLAFFGGVAAVYGGSATVYGGSAAIYGGRVSLLATALPRDKERRFWL